MGFYFDHVKLDHAAVVATIDKASHLSHEE